MKQQEWKVLYSAARMLLAARFRADVPSYKINMSGDPIRRKVWDIVYQEIIEMGHGIHDACFYDTMEIITPYPLPPTSSLNIKRNLSHT